MKSINDTPSPDEALPELPDDATVAQLRDLAVRLAEEAGELVRAGRPDQVVVAKTKSTPVDIVTQMDADSEALLRRRIAEARPRDGILGEEQGLEAGTSGVTWVVDPVDGTVNYLYGVGSYAVSVAAVVGDPDPARWTIVAGAVHSIVDRHTWSAGRGQGATCDGRPLPPPAPRPLAESLVGTGFSYDGRQRVVQAGVLAQVIGSVRDIRRLGSASIDLCLVAAGQLDLFYERGLNPWDMAAGALVVEESGRIITGLRGEPAGSGRRTLVAGPRDQAEALAQILEKAGAEDA